MCCRTSWKGLKLDNQLIINCDADLYSSTLYILAKYESLFEAWKYRNS